MVVPPLVDKLVTYLLLSLLVMGMVNAAGTVGEDTGMTTPWYETLYTDIGQGNFGMIFDLAKMGLGWASITPTIPVEQLPYYLQWYGAYYKIFIPEGFIPLPSVETTIFIAAVFIAIILPLAIYTKRFMRRRKQEAKLLGLPWYFYLSIPVALIALYPLWIWFNLQLFMYGAAGFFGITIESANALWISVSQNTESFSAFLFLVSLLGMYKAAVWSKFVKVGF